MWIVRRLVPQLGMMTVAKLAWSHRASVVRVADLATRVPEAIRDGRTNELAAEARAVLALDAVLPTDLSVRISGLDDGSLTLRGNPGARALAAARKQLVAVTQIRDIRTDGTDLPTADAEPAVAGI